jgi:uncharacterized protein (DUF433 family)
MKQHTIKLCIPDEVHAAIAERARQTGANIADMAAAMLDEAVRMQRVPGIVFADGPSGRRARIGGTGLEVWEVINGYRGMDEDWKQLDDWERLKEGYHWLTEHQLQAALAYARAYPDEIDEALRENDSWTPERVWATHPFTRASGAGPLVRFYLDEDLSPRAASIARAQGVDVLNSHDCGRNGLADESNCAPRPLMDGVS